ncbi:nickel-dependent hydrogenase large subunit [Thermosulfurimonas sp. F29]|uniref:nickel-dependent hydrogenase large subunit n=1 Tax=Thermosulfurimonas sp. F29 TaxID=2867247 RepID=UPI001C82884C|nr:nickel-dependent hydrogenase large subunit [Thermosulfurimonas sp. F29]MBX6424033.1 nickel-dependent hydrogenase large subunit [Thermosulfurimonas sp. F29]
MGKKISIRPLKRIEGEAGLEIVLDERHRVSRIKFTSEAFRGFEHFCVGRRVEEMPFLASRICGICAEAHYLASLKALDQIFRSPPPPQVQRIRRIFFLAGFIRDHLTVLSLFALPETSSEKKDSLCFLKEKGILPEFLAARKGLATILETIGGRKLHGGSGLPGSWGTPLDSSRIKFLGEVTRKVQKKIFSLGRIFWEVFSRDALLREKIFLPLRKERGLVALGSDFTEGSLLVFRKTIQAVEDYRKVLVESPGGEETSLKGKTYMVGPWARFRLWSPPRDSVLAELREKLFNCLKQLKGLSPALLHLFRVYELMLAAEKLLQEVETLEEFFPEEKTDLGPGNPEGVGLVEAPRGLLIHHYRIDGLGRITWLRILTPTAQNLKALKEDLENSLKKTTKISENVLFFLEEIIRAYDPCVPCMIHLLFPEKKQHYKAAILR